MKKKDLIAEIEMLRANSRILGSKFQKVALVHEAGVPMDATHAHVQQQFALVERILRNVIGDVGAADKIELRLSEKEALAGVA